MTARKKGGLDKLETLLLSDMEGSFIQRLAADLVMLQTSCPTLHPLLQLSSPNLSHLFTSSLDVLFLLLKVVGSGVLMLMIFCVQPAHATLREPSLTSAVTRTQGFVAASVTSLAGTVMSVM